MLEAGILAIGLYLIIAGICPYKKKAARLLPLWRHKLIYGKKAETIGKQPINGG